MSKILHRENNEHIAYCEKSIIDLNKHDRKNKHFIVDSGKGLEGILCDECWFTYVRIKKNFQ